MINDVQEMSKYPYTVDSYNKRVGYKIKDSVDCDIVYGYCTAFSYLKEYQRKNLVGEVADANLRKALRLRVSCG